MSNKGFDIKTLLDFKPPQYFCEKCYGLLSVAPRRKEKDIRCPVCNVEYIRTDEYGYYAVGSYLEEKGLSIDFDNLIIHSQKLARTVSMLNREEDHFPYHPPMKILLESFLNAEKFIHFVSLGISQSFVGILKLLAQRIKIRGIISKAEAWAFDEIGKYGDEAPGLDLRLFKKEPEYWNDSPHLKLIIIDGLLAFKGSANLTVTAWRKALNKLEIIESVTDINEVIHLNNSYFSPIWAKLSDIEKIEMTTVPF